MAEAISPGSGSERTDRLRKVTEYARLGIPQYWIVEHSRPAAAEDTVLEAVLDADKPITVSFDPAELLDF